MAFTLSELRAELEVLGYGGVPDHVMLNSLAQLNLGIPSSRNDELSMKDRSSREGICERLPPRRLHGSPVPGDRDLDTSKKKPSVGRKGLDAVCFTPEFAIELDEMRKMLSVMEGTKDKLYGSVSVPKRTGKGIGLAQEHEHYVGNLMDTWRLVGRTIRTRRSEPPIAREDGLAHFQKVQNSKHCTNQLGKDKSRRTLSVDSEPERELAVRVYSDRCKKLDCANACDKGLNQQEGLDVNKGPILSGHHQMDIDDGEGPEERIGIAKEDALNSDTGVDNAFKGEKVTDVENAGTRPVLIRQESISAISPGVSYQQGGMLYPEMFSDRCQDSDQLSNVEKDSPSNQDSNTNPLPSPAQHRPSPKAVLDELSALSNEQFLASLERSLDSLDPQDTIDQEAFANFNTRLAHAAAQSHVSLHRRAAPSVETENPIDSNVPDLRTPDRRGANNYSPLNDRSNLRAVEDGPQKCSKPVTKTKEFKSPDVSKNTGAVALKRSRSSRDATGSDRGETNGASLVKFTEDLLDSGLAAKTTPRSTRKTKSKKVLWQSLSDGSPRTPRRNGSACDASHLDISSFALSPVEVGEATSPRRRLSREQSCAADVLPEHRLGTCSVCPHGRKNSDVSRSPFGKSIDSSSSEFEASPKQKSASRKGVGVSPKQKLPLRKGSGPSGIYTPLFDQKKNGINSKVLFKGSRVISPMEFASEGPRQANRRAASASASLRSSTESARSSGPQRAPSSQSSKSTSGSSPYAKRSALNSGFGSRSSTSEGTGTPGVPWRGGKVDRVARFAEMQNLWKKDKFLEKSSKRKPQSFHRIFARLHLSHERYAAAYRERVLVDMRPRTEPAPFVVPSYKASDRVKTAGAFPLT